VDVAGGCLTKRIGLLGGAFDPVHSDHLRLAGECLNFDCCDEVWFVPAPTLRWDKSSTLSTQHRLMMLHLALKEFSQFRVCEEELNFASYRGTYYLLKHLNRKYAGAQFYWIAGADTYPRIVQWRDPEVYAEEGCNGIQLMQEFSLIIYARPGFALPDPSMHQSAGYKDLQVIGGTQEFCTGSCSSTQLRTRLLQGIGITGLVPPAVQHYIVAENLYVNP
jgi:nicotinate-nucleotide adenylyltransferase